LPTSRLPGTIKGISDGVLNFLSGDSPPAAFRLAQ